MKLRTLQRKQILSRHLAPGNVYRNRRYLQTFEPMYIFDFLSRHGGSTTSFLSGYTVQITVNFKRVCASPVCTRCGCCGLLVSLDHDLSRGSCNLLHLYTLDRQEQPVMMTIDHIIPKRHGGTNNRQNLQIMCETCNAKKGHMV